METAGVWYNTAIELTQETGKHMTAITENTGETTFLISVSVHVHSFSESKLWFPSVTAVMTE